MIVIKLTDAYSHEVNDVENIIANETTLGYDVIDSDTIHVSCQPSMIDALEELLVNHDVDISTRPHPFTQTDCEKIARLASGKPEAVIDPEECTVELDFDDNWRLVIPVSDACIIKIRSNGYVTNENWSSCKFNVENALEIYKIILDRMA